MSMDCVSGDDAPSLHYRELFKLDEANPHRLFASWSSSVPLGWKIGGEYDTEDGPYVYFQIGEWIMLFGRTTYKEVIEKAEHLVALGETRVFLDRDDVSFPWHNVSDVEVCGSIRLGAPTGVYLIVCIAGLSIHYPIDFEGPGANGRGVSLFNSGYLREVMMKLPTQARRKFAGLLEGQVLPSMAQRTKEIREALKVQGDSEDCVRGLVHFGKQDA